MPLRLWALLALVASLYLVAFVAIFPDDACGAVLDDFGRTDGPVGGKWAPQAALYIQAHALRASANTSSAYDSVLSKNQTVSVVWRAAVGTENDVLLKTQGTSFPTGHIEVRYDATAHSLQVNTWAPSKWTNFATWPATVVGGDTVTASCDSLGLVTAWINSAKIGEASVSAWPYAQGGGRVGITMGASSILDVIAVGGLSAAQPPQPPQVLNDPYLNVSLTWTWQGVDASGNHESSLAVARIWYRPNGSAQWSGNIVTHGAPLVPGDGRKVVVGMPWSWFGRQPTWFMVTTSDTSGNQSMPSNEVLKTPLP
jgi:hypothetical protein